MGKVESITIGYSPFESTALLWIAQDQDFLKRNGLKVTLRKYDTGAGSLDGMLNRETDITVGTTEFPLVRWAFQKARICTIGSIDKSEFVYLVGRKDRGIEKFSDLKGKRVGTTLRTIAEFHLGRFLELHGMNMQDISLVDVKTPAEWVNAVVKGDIDAIATAQPYAGLAKGQLGANAVFWPAQSSQLQYGLITSTTEWITNHPEPVRRLLRSLVQAEAYAIRNPNEAKAIVQKALNLKASYMETVWSQNQFVVSLDQPLILAMEDEARWMIMNKLTSEKQVPDFLEYIYVDGLKAVKPEAVNIIR
ncbi:MAG: NrtA/SsuA/CpmA family ABC transporter substrate-binding protein [Deltaproteobacteria bacterium]|nr:NrtA/SsuA/CpmA family ABC transporter substrate-binding protein [Deltaproteobacteria bacterium]